MLYSILQFIIFEIIIYISAVSIFTIIYIVINIIGFIFDFIADILDDGIGELTKHMYK